MTIQTKNPLISVIIPTHNSAETINAAIESMIFQTYPNLEIIIIDDNSTDNTKEVAENIGKTDPRVVYFSLPFNDPLRFNKRGRNINAGYMARNYGLEKAHGEWVTFQDADDASLLNRIEVQYDLAKRYNATSICLDWQKYKKGLIGKKLDVNKIFKKEKEIIIPKEKITDLAKRTKGLIVPFLGRLNSLIPFELKRLRIINKLFFRTLDPYPGTGNSHLFRREVIKKVKFRALKDRIWPSFMGRGADRDFNFQVAETFKNSFVFFIPLYLWRVKNENPRFTNTIDKFII